MHTICLNACQLEKYRIDSRLSKTSPIFFHAPVPWVEFFCQAGKLCEKVANGFQTGDIGHLLLRAAVAELVKMRFRIFQPVFRLGEITFQNLLLLFQGPADQPG